MATIILTLLLALSVASAATVERPDGTASAEWIPAFCYSVGIWCGSATPVVVPGHNLVMGFVTGVDCGYGLRVSRLFPDQGGPRSLRVEGQLPAGIPVAGVYDLRHDRVIYFFTEWSDSGTTPLTAAAVQIGDTMRWEQVETRAAPLAFSAVSVVLDTRHDQALLYGGYRVTNRGWVWSEDVWVLSLRDGVWRRFLPNSPGPGARAGHTAIYDSIRDRMVVFGGSRKSAPGPLSDVWELSLSGRPRWALIEPVGEAPPPRDNHVAVFDSREDRMIIEGGTGPGTSPTSLAFFHDLWTLPLRGRPRWHQVATRGYVPGSLHQAASYDLASDRVFIGDLQCVLALQWDPLERSPLQEADSAPLASNPWLTPSTLGDAQPTMADEEVRIYDVAGRLILTRSVPDASRWMAKFRANLTREASTMASGVYFARVRDRHGVASTSRAVLLHH